VLTLLLFPDGRLSDRRWQAAAWVSVLGVLLAEPGWTLDPDTGSVFVHGRNPFAVTWLPTDLMFGVGFAVLAASTVAALIALIVRFRGSGAVQRQQLKWVAFASAVLVVALPVAVVLGTSAPVAWILPPLALTAWPVAIGVAILRYRLYDIDLVISRTLAYLTLTAILSVVFAVTVLLLGTMFLIGAGLTVGFVCAAVAALHLSLSSVWTTSSTQAVTLIGNERGDAWQLANWLCRTR